MRRAYLSLSRLVGLTGVLAAAFLATLLAPIALAADGKATPQALVFAAPADAIDITIYGNRFAQIEETRTVRLKAGENRVQLTGIAARYRADSLRLIKAEGPGKFVYTSATYQPANLTSEKLLQESVGSQITVKRYAGGKAEELTGTLRSVNGATLVVETSSGKTVLVSGSEEIVIDTRRGVSNTATLVLEATVDVAGDYAINFLYETEGLTWQAKHSLIYDDEKSALKSWESSVSVGNQSGTSFGNATLRLLSGSAAGREGGPGRMYSGAPTRTLAADSVSEAAVEDVGDQKVYIIPGTVTLGDGQSRQIPLFVGSDIPVVREYVVSPDTYYVREGTRQDAVIQLTVENCAKHNLGKPLPAGTVKVYQYDSVGKLQLTGGTVIGHKSVDEVFQMAIGTASDIKWERKLLRAQEVTSNSGTTAPAPGGRPGRPGLQPGGAGNEPVYEDHTYEITIYNFKRSRDVEVMVEVTVPAKQPLPKEFVKKSADRAETKVSVAKSDKVSVEYTIRVQTR